MLTFDMGPLAERLGCEAEVAAYTGPFIGWCFLAAMLREMPVPDGEAKAVVVDPVIAGINLLAAGKDWPKAAAAARAAARSAALEATWAAICAAAWAAAGSAVTAAVSAGGRPAVAAAAAWAAAKAAAAAAEAGLSFPRQRDILLRLIEEANE
jgi:hypothetical protein